MHLAPRLAALLSILVLLACAPRAKAQFMPDDVSGLLVWYAADSAITKDGGNNVSAWGDLSGNANNATQGVAGSQPLWVDSVGLLNYHPVVRFDQDFMGFSNLTNIRTVFLLINHEDGGPVSGTSPVLGHSSATDFYSDGSNVIGSFASNSLKSGAGAVNGVSQSPTSIQKNPQYSVITLVATANVTAERLTKDRNFNFYWDGDYVEVLLYDNALSAADQDSVEAYLFDKYAPPVSLGPDINQTYGFCDVVLDAQDRFVSYAWSTGDTVSNITVTQPGTYWVDVVDVFGRASSDTIVVNIAGQPNSFADSVVCLGDTIYWNTGLANDGHTFTWNDMSTDSLLTISAGGNVFVSIADTNGCTFTSDTFAVQLDTFALLMTLGPDTPLCAGNAIGLKAGAGQTVGYSWSTLESTPTIVISTTGTYAVTATNTNGCIGIDSVDVTIVGAAPNVAFEVTNECLGDTTTFTDQTTPAGGNGLASWSWNFGDTNSDTLASTTHLYNGPDSAYTVTLTVLDSAGCGGQLSKTAFIIQPPTLGLTYNLASVGTAVNFVADIDFNLGEAIDSIQWSFGSGDSSVAVSPSYIYSGSGNFLVDYQVFSDSGCYYTFDSLILVYDSAAAFPQVTLVSPPNQTLTASTNIEFVWDGQNQDGETYQLQIATDSAFTALLLDSVGLDTNALLVAGLPLDATIYWRVRLFAGAAFSEFSNLWSVTTFDVSTISGLSQWYKADEGVIVAGADSVVTWQDQSGNGNHANQTTAASRPQLVPDVALINHMPAIHFDGTNDWMSFNANTSIRTFYFVIDHDLGDISATSLVSSPILADPSSFDFFSDGANVIGNFANNNIKNGAGYFNTLAQSPTSMAKPTQPAIISGVTLGNVGASRLTKDRNVNGYWGGNYIEVMLFDSALSDSSRALVDAYLRDKYAPPVSLGPDVFVEYGFCPQTLDAGDRFVAWAWSNGDTTQTTDVTANGVYSVTATDVFGFASVDSVRVTYPFAEFADTTICLGDTTTWVTGLDTVDYSFVWSDGSNEADLPMAVQGSYHVQVIDSNACSWFSDTIVLITDSFPALVSLGPDDQYCRFNNFSPVAGADLITNIVWSNGETTTTIVLDSAATYSIEATDTLGCFARDTVIISLNGVAPSVSFTAPTTCEGDSTQFANTTVIVGGLQSSWKWHFGDGDSSTVENPTHLYAAGDSVYSVSLTVTDTSGCANTESAQISNILTPALTINYEFPIFVDSLVEYTFTGDFNWNDGPQSVLYDFGDTDSVFTDTALHSYTSPGNFTLQFTIVSDSGCATTLDTALTIYDPAPVLPAIALVSPVDSFLTSNTLVNLVWDPAGLPDVEYHLEISFDPLFGPGTILFSEYQLDTNAIQLLLPAIPATYYWRVRYYDTDEFSGYSNVWSFSYFAPSQFAGNLIWYAADLGIAAANGDSIALWSDLSGSNNHATQSDSTLRPVLLDGIARLNHLPVARFDGTNDYMQFSNLTTIQEVIMVLKHSNPPSGNQSRPVLGHDTQADYHATATQLFSTFSSPNVQAGQAYVNGVATGPTSVAIPVEYSIISLETAGPTTANRITRDRNFANNVWNGDFAEIILYDNVLNTDDREAVERYLHNKYAPPVSLGPNIYVDYGFCPIVLDASDRFVDYVWSNGDTTQTLIISSTGAYAVTVTDVFGAVSSDSIWVEYPVREIADTLLCYGDSTEWNSGLSHNGYSFIWSDGGTDSSLVLSQANDYWLIATDSTGCSYFTDTMTLQVDSFPVVATLGPDTSICSGNELQLIQGADQAVSYVWNTGAFSPSIVVDTSGLYSLFAADSNGCSINDSVQINILGDVPIVDFSSSNFCNGDSTQFVDQTPVVPGANPVAWDWNFDDLSSSSDQNPAHVFSGAQTWSVTLTVTTDSGCVGVSTQDVIIEPRPDVSFATSLPCNGAETQFTDQSQFADSLWMWSFGDPASDTLNTSDLQNPLHTFDQIGTYQVTLVAVNTSGCIDSASQSVQVFVSPQADFDAAETCEGDTMFFVEDANGFNLTYNWVINGSNYNGPTASHFFVGPGSYLAKLTVIDPIGCTDTFADTVAVHSHPTADFTTTVPCPGSPFNFVDQTIPGDGELESWTWSILFQDTLTGASPSMTLDEAGPYNVILDVVDEFGCFDNVQSIITLDELPEAVFNFTPKFGAPPLEVQFTNGSVADSVWWNFGTGDTSIATEPTYTYQDIGTYNITLYAFNEVGCMDSLVRPIDVRDPLIDLAIENLSVSNSGDYMTVFCNVVNLGSIEISSFDMTARFNGTPAVRETWTGSLESGAAMPFQFSTAFEQVDQGAVCVTVSSPNVSLIDEQPSNDQQCIPVVEEFTVLLPYPNPATEYINLPLVIPVEEQVDIELYDYTGNLVDVIWQGTLDEGLQSLYYPIPTLRSGVYVFRIAYRDHVETVRFVKTK